MRFKLKEIRLEKRMTQEDLAMKSGISRQTIVSIENASTVNVTFKTLVSLADALGVKVDQLFCPK